MEDIISKAAAAYHIALRGDTRVYQLYRLHETKLFFTCFAGENDFNIIRWLDTGKQLITPPDHGDLLIVPLGVPAPQLKRAAKSQLIFHIF